MADLVRARCTSITTSNQNYHFEFKCKRSSPVIEPKGIEVHGGICFSSSATTNALLMFVTQLVTQLTLYSAFSTLFLHGDRGSGDERAGALIEIIDQPKCGGENAKCRSRAPAYRDTHVRPRGQGQERGEESGRWVEPPDQDRPRICKRSFQLTATIARRIGRCAANSKPIRHVHARKSSTSSAPNTSRLL